MRIGLITLGYPFASEENSLYSDLMDELSNRGHDVDIFVPIQGHFGGHPIVRKRLKTSIHGIPSGQIVKTSPWRKAINTMVYQFALRRYLVRHCRRSPLDLLLYATPPIDSAKTIKYLKRRLGCSTYLLLKDIFPANAVDLGMIKRGGLIWSHFRKVEKLLYEVSDRIGCMSPANVDYLLGHNPTLDPGIVEVCPNSIRPSKESDLPERDSGYVAEFGVPTGPLRLVYGGNLGKPQGIEFLLEILASTRANPDVHFVIVGDGTEFHRLAEYKLRTGHPFTLVPCLPKNQFRKLLRNMDAGLIFLDRRFTIPNFPSRILDYLDLGLPVLAATDTCTDIKEFLIEQECGLWSEAGDVDAFLANIARLNDPRQRARMGRNARIALCSKFNVTQTADHLLESFRSLADPALP